MECRFVVGQKVVCVDGFPGGFGIAPICEGAIYTIRQIRLGYNLGASEETPGVCLAEITNPHSRPGVEKGYMPHRFRPIHSTQIEDLRKLAIDAFNGVKSGDLVPSGVVR